MLRFGTVAACALGLCVAACDDAATRSEPVPSAATGAMPEPRPTPEPWASRIPTNLASSLPAPERNPTTIAGVELGKRLFYDPILSANDAVSCATCHRQAKAFSDGEALTRAGISGQPLQRNAPALINLAWQPGFFWDGGGYDLESQAFAPIKHPNEMGQKLDLLLRELKARPPYPELFLRAFADGLTIPNIVRAIAQFERTLISASSRYDRHVRGEGVVLTAAETAGLGVFERRCANCHQPDFFTDHRYHNNGLDSVYPDDDEYLAWGRGRITRADADRGAYKTPTLRNIMLTAPYMHDGRFATIEAVLDHYRSGVRDSATLDPVLRHDGELGIPLSAADGEVLIAFLHTLTDHDFITDPRHAPAQTR